MRERHVTLFNLKRRRHVALCGRRLCVRYLSIAGALLLLAVLLAVNQETPTSEPDTHSETPVPQDTEHPTPAVFETETFYQTIIENNLFRSLGWTPPRPTEPYRLIGTILPTDDRTRPKAILQTTAGNQTYIVTTGGKIDASTEVVSIKPKQVTLSTDGQQRTLRLVIGF